MLVVCCTQLFITSAPDHRPESSLRLEQQAKDLLYCRAVGVVSLVIDTRYPPLFSLL